MPQAEGTAHAWRLLKPGRFWNVGGDRRRDLGRDEERQAGATLHGFEAKVRAAEGSHWTPLGRHHIAWVRLRAQACGCRVHTGSGTRGGEWAETRREAPPRGAFSPGSASPPAWEPQEGKVRSWVSGLARGGSTCCDPSSQTWCPICLSVVGLEVLCTEPVLPVQGGCWAPRGSTLPAPSCPGAAA